MFKETKDGQTHYCDHTEDGSICDKCLGKIKLKSMEYITIKYKDDGIMRPTAFLWKADENLKYHLPEIEKAIKKGATTLIKVNIEEMGEITIEDIIKLF